MPRSAGISFEARTLQVDDTQCRPDAITATPNRSTRGLSMNHDSRRPMTRSLVFAAALSSLAFCAHADALEDLKTRLDGLAGRVAALEHRQLPDPNQPSAAATRAMPETATRSASARARGSFKRDETFLQYPGQ
jgi:hypothetical protein